MFRPTMKRESGRPPRFHSESSEPAIDGGMPSHLLLRETSHDAAVGSRVRTAIVPSDDHAAALLKAPGIDARRAATRFNCAPAARRGRAATRARPARTARAAPRSRSLLKPSPSQLRPIFLPPLILRHRRSIEPLHLGDGFHIPKRLHLVARSAHELIRLAWIDRVRRRVLSDQAFGCLAAPHTACAALALQERVVLARCQIEAGHRAAP